MGSVFIRARSIFSAVSVEFEPITWLPGFSRFLRNLLSEEGGEQPNGGLLWDRKFFGQIRWDWKTEDVSSL